MDRDCIHKYEQALGSIVLICYVIKWVSFQLSRGISKSFSCQGSYRKKSLDIKLDLKVDFTDNLTILFITNTTVILRKNHTFTGMYMNL